MKKEFIKKLIKMIGLTLVITNINYVSASAAWIKDSKNNWNWIENNIKAIGWKEVDKKWYYFDEKGVMKNGWIKFGEKWYNLADSGEMEIGWKKIDEKWYHFDSDGAMSIGWLNDNGTWYYMNFSGEMETGTIGIDGQVYTFSSAGELISGKETIQVKSMGLDNSKTVWNDNLGKNDDKNRIGYVDTSGDLLNIRSEASITSDIIGTIAKNKEVKITGEPKDGFYPMVFNDRNGWVSTKWITFEKPKDLEKGEISDSKDIVSKVDDDKELENASLGKDTLRDKAPDLDDKHYYSDDNLFYKVKLSPPFTSGGKPIKGNCTWYAWGRAWELTGKKPSDAGFIGNGYEWWEANKKSGKYQYGSEPRVGAIAVWKPNLPNSGGDGHVAIVEKIENNKIYISESMWHGVTFKYREIYETNYLYGYIYLDKPNH